MGVWDRETGCECMRFECIKKPRSLDFSPDGKNILIKFKNSVLLIDAETGQESDLIPLEEDTRMLVFTLDGKKIITGTKAGKITVWDIYSRKPVKVFEHGGEITAMICSPDGEKVIVGGYNGIVKLWDTGKENESLVLDVSSPAVIYSLVCSADGKKVAVCADDRKPQIWDMVTGQKRWSFCPPRGEYPFLLTFSPDNNYLYIVERNTQGFEKTEDVLIFDLYFHSLLEWLKKNVTLSQAILIAEAYKAKIENKPFVIHCGSNNFRILMGIENKNVRYFLVHNLSILLKREDVAINEQ